jgi:fatty acid amide hydrolase 2
MAEGELTKLGAVALARMIRERQVSPSEVVEAHIKRIEAVNPRINALVIPAFDQAREQARRQTEALAKGKGDLPPLFGVPVTVKDAFPVAGLRFTAGSIYQRDHIADRDAEVVQRLKSAGAIILGKTNLPDVCSSVETNNPVFGRTNNPWDPSCSAGGSSGGEGALIAAGGSPLGIGSDIAGSIRLPSAFCGVAGLKPSGGRISTDGHIPEACPPLEDWNTTGPLARRVEDLALALGVLSGTPTRDYRKITFEGRHLVLPKLLPLPVTSSEVRGAISSAVEILADLGMQIEREVRIPAYQTMFRYVALMQRYFVPLLVDALGGGFGVRVWRDLYLNWAGRGRVSKASLALILVARVFGPVCRALGYGRVQGIDRLREFFRELLGPGGVLLWPVFPTTAPKHGFAWRLKGIPAYTLPFNLLGLPCVVVPMGRSEGGLPLSVQVVAEPGSDEVALAVGEKLEME